LLQYFVDEAKDKKNITLDMSEWVVVVAADDPSYSAPQQRNGVDCGMFTILFGDFLSDGLPLSGFCQDDINSFRRRTVAAILRGSLSYALH
jgi:Ulp1 family protease